MYTTTQAHGVPNYSLVFFFVEVNGPETNYGNSGNWALWGKIDNERALKGFKHFYNYPYSLSENISIQRKGNEAITTVHEKNGEGFALTMKVKTDKPFSAEGMANSYSQLSNGSIIQIQIPWLVDGNEAELISFDVNAGDNKTLALLRGVKPFFGVVSKNSFSYAAPIATK